MNLVNDEELKRLGELIQARRKAEHGTKYAAYKAAGVNSATWDRAEAGLPIREDRMGAVLRALWGHSVAGPEQVLAKAETAWMGLDQALRPDFSEADPATAELASWAQENFERINQTLAQLAEAVEQLDRKVGQEHGKRSAEKSDDDPDEGGASVTRLPRKGPKPSDGGARVDPAALDAEETVDEAPGESDHDES